MINHDIKNNCLVINGKTFHPSSVFIEMDDCGNKFEVYEYSGIPSELIDGEIGEFYTLQHRSKFDWPTGKVESVDMRNKTMVVSINERK